MSDAPETAVAGTAEVSRSGPSPGRKSCAAAVSPAAVRLGGGSAGSEPRRKVLVPIADSSEEIETACITDTLSRFGAEVIVAKCDCPNPSEVGDATEGLVCRMSRGLKVVADMTIERATKDEYDAIVLPGGMMGARHLRESEPLMALLRRQRQDRKLYGGICASPAVVLADAGLLGPGATCYPARVLRDGMSDPSDEDVAVQEGGTVVTSQGPGTSLRFALWVGELLYGRSKADAVARKLLVDRDEPPYSGGAASLRPRRRYLEDAMAEDDSDDEEMPAVGAAVGNKRKRSPDGRPCRRSKRKTPIPESAMFDQIVWPVLAELGWTMEIGTSTRAIGIAQHRYYLLPGVSRFMKGAKKQVHYFDSKKSVIEFLTCDKSWSTQDMIGDCLDTLNAAYARGPDLIAMGKVPESCTGLWLASELRRNPFIAEVPLFDYIVLPAIKKMGWTTEEGGADGCTKMFYLPPYVTRNRKKYTCDVDYFSTRAGVLKFLMDSDTWGNMDEILTCVELFQACISLGKDLHLEGKQLEGLTPEWLLTEAKRRRPALRGDAVVPTLTPPTPVAKDVSMSDVEKLGTSSGSEESNGSTAPKKPPEKPPCRNANIFDRLIWLELEKFQWHIEYGHRPTDKYYCKPNTHRGRPFSVRIDYFDSVKQVIDFLRSDEEWSGKEEIRFALQRYNICKDVKRQLAADKKLPKEWTPEWLLEQVSPAKSVDL